MQQSARKVYFAPCPRCFWFVTHFKQNEKNKLNCPRCGRKLRIQTVIVKLSIEGNIEEERSSDEQISNSMKFDGIAIDAILRKDVRCVDINDRRA